MTHARQPRMPAFTLVELVVSLAIASVILLGLTSAVFVAARSLPAEDGPIDAVIQQSRVATELTTELQHARYIVERTATAITFTLADRTGDGIPERIRYAWSGTPGDPLTRQFNDGTVVTVLENVHDFTLTYDLKSLTETYPGPPVEGAEQVIASYLGSVDLKSFGIDDDHWLGQYLHPPEDDVPNDAITWRVTRAMFEAKTDGGDDEELLVQIRTANNDHSPTETVLDQQILVESTLSDDYEWEEIAFSNAAGFSLDEGACLVLQHGSDSGHSAKIRFDTDAGCDLLRTDHAGDDWRVYVDRAMRHYVLGKISVPGPDQTATRHYVTGVRIALQTRDDANARNDTAARLFNAPEVLAGLWEAEFDTDPNRPGSQRRPARRLGRSQWRFRRRFTRRGRLEDERDPGHVPV